MSVKGWKFPLDEYTYRFTYKHWCQISSCDKCKTVREAFADDSRFYKNVWRTSRIPEKLENLLPGSYVMGDLNTLGWVVLKAF